MKNAGNMVELKSYRVEKQYEKFYIAGNINLASDFRCLHKNTNNYKKEYIKAWIKLLTINLQNN